MFLSENLLSHFETKPINFKDKIREDLENSQLILEEEELEAINTVSLFAKVEKS